MKQLSACATLLLLFACGTPHPKSTTNAFDASEEIIQLLVKDLPMEQLRKKREEALKLGTLLGGKNDWVDAVLVHNGKSKRAKIRLKGYLSDHWNDEREWSLKVKMAGKASVNGMNRFALQRPVTRGFMNEWIFHKFLAYNRLIALRYDFVHVSINGDLLPVYAIEENFHSNLIKRHGKPAGVLFKFNDDLYWRHKPGLASRFYGASITAYQAQKVKNNDVLRAQFKTIIANIEEFRNEKVKTHEIFDCKLMARFFVAVDIMGHHHATALDNIRFYFNPNTGLIEPIGYDNQLISDLSGQGLLGANKMINGHRAIDEWNFTNGYWYQHLFADTVFMKAYIQELKDISRKEHMDEFFSQTDDEYSEKLALIQQSYPEYEFTRKEALYQNQLYIRGELEKLNFDAEQNVVDVVGAYSKLVNKFGKFAVKDTTIQKYKIARALDEGYEDYNLALLDILGCIKGGELIVWLGKENHGLKHRKLTYKAISQRIMGSSLNVNGLPLNGNTKNYTRYIQALKMLCETDDFEGQVAKVTWFDKYYQAIGSTDRSEIDQNRAFLLKYLSPYKALKASFKGTNSPAEAIVLVAQNIHKLAIEIKSLAINGQVIPLEKPQLLRGNIEGEPLTPVRFQVKVGAALIPILARVVNESQFELKQFEMNYSIYGTDRIITEPILQHN